MKILISKNYLHITKKKGKINKMYLFSSDEKR